MRRAARTDLNKREIVNALIAAGVSVYDLKLPCDLLAGRGGKSFCLEIKSGKSEHAERKLTPAQLAFKHTWRGHFAIVTTPEEALKAVGL